MLKQVADRPVDLSNQSFLSFINQVGVSISKRKKHLEQRVRPFKGKGKLNILWPWPPNRCIDTLKPMKSHSNIGLRLSLPLFYFPKRLFRWRGPQAREKADSNSKNDFSVTSYYTLCALYLSFEEGYYQMAYYLIRSFLFQIGVCRSQW